MQTEIILKTPTEAQNAAYRECLRFDRKRFDERRAGRAGYLSAEDEAAHRTAGQVVDAALADGVGFDRMSFGDEAA